MTDAELFETQISSCRVCDKAQAAFNVTHQLVASTIWDVPYGREYRFGNHSSRVLDAVAGGWIFDCGQVRQVFYPSKVLVARK